MIIVRDHDRRLEVAEGLDGLEGLLVDGEVEHLVVDALAVEGAVGRGALDARGLGVDRHSHGWCLSGGGALGPLPAVARCAGGVRETVVAEFGVRVGLSLRPAQQYYI